MGRNGAEMGGREASAPPRGPPRTSRRRTDPSRAPWRRTAATGARARFRWPHTASEAPKPKKKHRKRCRKRSRDICHGAPAPATNFGSLAVHLTTSAALETKGNMRNTTRNQAKVVKNGPKPWLFDAFCLVPRRFKASEGRSRRYPRLARAHQARWGWRCVVPPWRSSNPGS